MPLSKNDLSFLYTTLPKVSRTFALNIVVLPKQQKFTIATAYLVCRFLDTLEDSTKLKAEEKIQALLQAKNILRTGYSESALSDFTKKYGSCGENEAENELMSKLPILLRLYRAVPDAYFPAVQRCAIKMAGGMIKQVGLEDPVPQDMGELQRYCYYVAGTVGEMLTKVFSAKVKNDYQKGLMVRTSLAFAEALQLVNIIKDFKKDDTENRRFIPLSLVSKKALSQVSYAIDGPLKPIYLLAKKDILHAIDYTFAIPWHHLRQRLFCAIPLLLAIKTYVLLVNDSGQVKLDKKAVKKTVLQSQVAVLFSRKSFFTAQVNF